MKKAKFLIDFNTDENAFKVGEILELRAKKSKYYTCKKHFFARNFVENNPSIFQLCETNTIKLNSADVELPYFCETYDFCDDDGSYSYTRICIKDLKNVIILKTQEINGVIDSFEIEYGTIKNIGSLDDYDLLNCVEFYEILNEVMDKLK